MIAGQRADDADQQRVEREERHIRSLIAGRRDVEIVYGVPASPDGEQQVRDSCTCMPARWPMITAANSAMTMIANRGRHEIDKHLANRFIEAGRDEHFADAEQRRADRRRSRAPCAPRRRKNERQPEQQRTAAT